jgi:hypothetical protein
MVHDGRRYVMRTSRSLVSAVGAVAAASLVTVVMAVGASAHSAAAKNLIVNGNAEQGEGVNDASGIAADIPGWTRKGNFTVVTYGAPDFPSPELSTKIRGGLNFFAGGPKNVASSISQDIDVSSQKKLINAGKAKATLSGNVGGFFTQTDWLRATAVFLAGSGERLGAIKIQSATPAARKNQTDLPKKTITGPVPKQTRTIRVVLAASRGAGEYNDGYADNLSLTIGR